MTRGSSDEQTHAEELDGKVLSVHFGRSANCSSVGSVIDFLYIGTVAASAVLAALAVLLPGDDDATDSTDASASPKDASADANASASPRDVSGSDAEARLDTSDAPNEPRS